MPTSKDKEFFPSLSHRQDLVVDSRYIDPYNHLNHVAWGIYLEEGRHTLAKKEHISINGQLVTDQLAQEVKINFKGQIKQGDNISILTKVDNTPEGVKFNQEIYKKNELVGTASTTYDKSSQKLTSPLESPLLEHSLLLDEEFFILKNKNIKQLATLVCFETERLRLLQSRGLTIDTFTKMGIIIVATSIDAQFSKEMKPGQKVSLKTDVSNKGVKIIFHQQMLESDELICEASTTYVAVDISGEEPKIIRPAQNLLDQLQGTQKIAEDSLPDSQWLT